MKAISAKPLSKPSSGLHHCVARQVEAISYGIIHHAVNIKEIIATIKQMQADGVIGEYAIGGAVAATFYLVEPDTTKDIDIFVSMNPAPGQSVVSPQQIFSWLRAQGYQIDAQGCVRIADWPVQFLPPSTPLVEEALQGAIERDVEGMPVRVFTLEHLAAIALEVGRPKDKTRLVRFLESKEFNEALFSEILERNELLERWAKFKKQMLD